MIVEAAASWRYVANLIKFRRNGVHDLNKHLAISIQSVPGTSDTGTHHFVA